MSECLIGCGVGEEKEKGRGGGGEKEEGVIQVEVTQMSWQYYSVIMAGYIILHHMLRCLTAEWRREKLVHHNCCRWRARAC